MNIWPSPDGTPESTSKKLTPLAPSSITTPMPAHWRACLHSRINRIRTNNRMKEVNQAESRWIRLPILNSILCLEETHVSCKVSKAFADFFDLSRKILEKPVVAGCGQLWPAVASCGQLWPAVPVSSSRMASALVKSLAFRASARAWQRGNAMSSTIWAVAFRKNDCTNWKNKSHTLNKQWHPRLLCLTHQVGHCGNM